MPRRKELLARKKSTVPFLQETAWRRRPARDPFHPETLRQVAPAPSRNAPKVFLRNSIQKSGK